MPEPTGENSMSAPPAEVEDEAGESDEPDESGASDEAGTTVVENEVTKVEPPEVTVDST